MIHSEFELEPDLIYLNHAGVAPWPRRTREAVARFAEENSHRGATDYPRWMEVEKRLRNHLRQLLNAPSTDDIALVKNTSEALSMVAYGLDWKAGDNIVSSNEEFPSNRIPWDSLRNKGVELRRADLTSTPLAEEALFELVDRHTRMITISSVQYASGRRMNLQRIGEFCHKRGILFCVDAIQSVGAIKADVQAWQADYVMADGHKWLLGPEGVGFFYTTPRSRDLLQLNQYGWHMVKHAGDYDRTEWQIAPSARRFECGSPNMVGIFGLEASTSLLLDIGMDAVERQVLANAFLLIEKILADPDLELLSPAKAHAGIVTFRPVSGNSSRLFDHLRDHNVICAQRGGGIRFSAHFHNGETQLVMALDLVKMWISTTR